MHFLLLIHSFLCANGSATFKIKVAIYFILVTYPIHIFATPKDSGKSVNQEISKTPQHLGKKTPSNFKNKLFYDEVYDERGNPRSEYAELLSLINQQSQNELKSFLVNSYRAFKGDNKLHPMPRIIVSDEYDKVIKPGVEQRGKAIWYFLKDHYSGDRRYAKYGIVSENVITRIIDRYNEGFFEGHINPRDISFPYGPDLMRDSGGVWRVIEDNHGYVGGLGDLLISHDLIKNSMPKLFETYKFRNVYNWFDRLVELFKQTAREYNTEKVVLLTRTPYPENEDKRIIKSFSQFGVEYVTQNTMRQLKVMEDGVYIYDKKNPEVAVEKVGFIILQGEPNSIDPSFEIIRAIVEGKVGTNYYPGIEFIGDKEFYMYVEDLIRFYLKEEPILKNIETFGIKNRNRKNLLKDKDKFVLKKVDGRGGDSVWVGPKNSNSQFRKALNDAMEFPDNYLLQKYTPLSRLKNVISNESDLIVDMRPISYVHRSNVHVGFLWGRGIPENGNGKVNLSDSGREITVLISDGYAMECKNIFAKP